MPMNPNVKEKRTCAYDGCKEFIIIYKNARGRPKKYCEKHAKEMHSIKSVDSVYRIRKAKEKAQSLSSDIKDLPPSAQKEVFKSFPLFGEEAILERISEAIDIVEYKIEEELQEQENNPIFGIPRLRNNYVSDLLGRPRNIDPEKFMTATEIETRRIVRNELRRILSKALSDNYPTLRRELQLKKMMVNNNDKTD